MNAMKLLAGRQTWSDSVEFRLMARNESVLSVGLPVVMQEKELGLYYEPTFTLPELMVQELIDQLWRDGFRPSAFRESEISAQARHLHDMRVLVNKAYKVTL